MRTRWFLAAVMTVMAGTANDAGVAGKFYPADAAHLRAAIAAYLDDAVPPGADRPLGLLAPHAGYIYSGQIAADAWRQVQGLRYDVIVLLGTNHVTGPFAGAAVFTGEAMRTPLGDAAVDRDLARALLARGAPFVERPGAHAGEHSLEVQVPMAQVVLPGVKILPVVIGTGDPALCRRIGKELAAALRGRDALIVASSDLSHYPAQELAARSDSAVLAAAATLDAQRVGAVVAEWQGRSLPGLDTCACGAGAVMTMLATARELGARRAVVLSHATSGETSVGDPQRVVGYGALVVTAGVGDSDTSRLASPAPAAAAAPLDRADQIRLLALARETIERYLDTETVPLVRGVPARLLVRQGAFVTLHDAAGQLRGCVGSLAADRPLGQVVGSMAIQAAFNDRRFTPVTRAELPGLTLEISVLSPPTPVASAGEIVVGRDGVMLQKDGRSAVFLPQVAPEQGWDRDTLLTQLCRKASLPDDAWRQRGARLSSFQAQVFQE